MLIFLYVFVNNIQKIDDEIHISDYIVKIHLKPSAFATMPTNCYEQENKARCPRTSNSVRFDFPRRLLAYKLRISATKVFVYERALMYITRCHAQLPLNAYYSLLTY